MKVKNPYLSRYSWLQLKKARIKIWHQKQRYEQKITQTNSFLCCMARFSLIQQYCAKWGEKSRQNTLNEPKLQTRWMLRVFQKKISHRSATVWTYILEKPSVLRQALGCQCFCDVVEGKQRSVLLQAILTLHWLEQNGNELRPLPWAIQAGHLRYQHCNLGCYLFQNRDRKQNNHHQQNITRQQMAMLGKMIIYGKNKG